MHFLAGNILQQCALLEVAAVQQFVVHFYAESLLHCVFILLTDGLGSAPDTKTGFKHGLGEVQLSLLH